MDDAGTGIAIPDSAARRLEVRQDDGPWPRHGGWLGIGVVHPPLIEERRVVQQHEPERFARALEALEGSVTIVAGGEVNRLPLIVERIL